MTIIYNDDFRPNDDDDECPSMLEVSASDSGGADEEGYEEYLPWRPANTVSINSRTASACPRKRLICLLETSFALSPFCLVSFAVARTQDQATEHSLFEILTCTCLLVLQT